MGEGKMKRLIILRGKPTAGKSTAFANLRKNKKMKEIIFIDHPELKKAFGKDEAKKKLFAEIVDAMETGKDILTEEMSEETLMKNIGKEIKENSYKIVIFQFEISFETALMRNVERSKIGWHKLMTEQELKDLFKMHEEKFDKNAILVDCNKLNEKQVVEFIIKKLY